MTLREVGPGILLCVAVAEGGVLLQRAEEGAFGHPYLEALVVAILLGTAIRTVWQPGPLWRAGIAFSAKQVLEVAIVLLGASLSLSAILDSGPALLAGIVATVALSLGASYAICRALSLPARMCILIACGNSICGNSAIAAVAPVIGAKSDEVAASISFTAVLGVLMVIGLPLAIPLAGYSASQYGVLAGLTVYAVPQVLAATAPAGAASVQIGTLVKLVRVLMLGPVVVAFSLLAPRLGRGEADAEAAGGKPSRPGIGKLVPWFIVGFLLLAAARSLGLVPGVLLEASAQISGLMTVVAMAALGLGVDVRVLARIGGRVTLAVSLSLAMLVAVSVVLIRLLGIA